MDRAQVSAGVVASLTPEERAERVEARRSTFATDATNAGICVADGFGVHVSVDRGALVVSDGVGPHRRTRRFERATHGLRRLVVMRPGAGYVTWEALSWCSALGVAVLVLDRDGNSELASAPRLSDDARLRRAQALAPGGPAGLEIARYLLGAKVKRQAELVVKRFGSTLGVDPETGEVGTAESMASLAEAIAQVEGIEEARQLEASAAALYFSAWATADVAPRFRTADRSRLPAHWLRYEGRRSVLASACANRKAERPVNALLNYVFGLVEAEAVLACQAVGLDAGLGVVHNDTKGRASMALDIMEPVRPLAEAFVLNLVGSRTFRKTEFTEAPDGHVRLLAPLTHLLAESLPTWAGAIAPVAERVAHLLGQAMAGRFTASTPLTRDRARAAQAVVKARKAQAQDRASRRPTRQAPTQERLALYSCPECGGSVANPRHVRCQACQDKDPRQVPTVRAARGLAISRARKRDAELANAGFGCIDAWPAIQAGLASVGLSAIMARCEVSKSTAWSWKTGGTRPAPRHWSALAELARSEPMR